MSKPFHAQDRWLAIGLAILLLVLLIRTLWFGVELWISTH